MFDVDVLFVAAAQVLAGSDGVSSELECKIVTTRSCPDRCTDFINVDSRARRCGIR